MNAQQTFEHRTKVYKEREKGVSVPLYNGVHSLYADMFWRKVQHNVDVSAVDSLYITRALNYIMDMLIEDGKKAKKGE